MIAGRPASAREVLEALRRKGERMTELLAELASIETPSTRAASQEPALSLLAAELEARGFRARRLAGAVSGGMLYAQPRGFSRRRRPRQLLLGHLDTIWPLGSITTMPVRREEGRLYGPGVYDMKAGIVQMLFALGEMPRSAPVAPVVLLTTDEEIGSPDSAAVIQELARGAERVFVMEPSLGPTGRLKTARKGAGRFVVHVHGRAAHAGLDPEHGASAILELSRVVQALFSLNDPEKGTTVNVGTIDGGIGANVVAARARAEVDVRVRTVSEGERIARDIRALRPSTPGTELEIEGEIGRPPLPPTASRELLRLARRAGAALGLSIEGGEAGGTSDGNLTAPLAPTLDGLGAVGAGAHAEHEHVEIERMPERAALLALLLQVPSPASLTRR